MMGEQIVFWEFLVALCMGLASFSVFIWAVLNGELDEESEDVKHRVMEREWHDE
ncbi:MAG: hypothetical protein KJ950_05970 [Proteobacteria bacterium]|nr:hypothetical protein [Pseudomonadota bacterium]MBU1688731.1 hypothetical protein [Pseudomonadota bacterium]